MIRNLVLLCLIAGAGLFLAPPAQAAELCNRTSYVLQAAVGWDVEGGAVVRGWTRVRPGECVIVPTEIDLDGDAPLYLYARSSAAYLGGVREWRGQRRLCVDETDFDIVSGGRCEALGLTARDFISLSGDHRERATLVEPADFGRRAGDAGLQRLLRAAGYDISLVDGYSGRRTSQAISAFLEDSGMDSRPRDSELIDALEAAALRRNAASGVSACNETAGDIALAIAHRREQRWESRGWWRLAPGECGRVLDEWLETASTYVYAERLAEDGARPLTGGTEQFCYAPARFLAEGRDQCAERGYGRTAFRAIPDPENGGVRMVFQEADFQPGARR